jgi:hypothetical protein
MLETFFYSGGLIYDAVVTSATILNPAQFNASDPFYGTPFEVFASRSLELSVVVGFVVRGYNCMKDDETSWKMTHPALRSSALSSIAAAILKAPPPMRPPKRYLCTTRVANSSEFSSSSHRHVTSPAAHPLTATPVCTDGRRLARFHRGDPAATVRQPVVPASSGVRRAGGRLLLAERVVPLGGVTVGQLYGK